MLQRKDFLNDEVRFRASVEDIERLLKCLNHDLMKTKHQNVFPDLR